MSRRKVSIALLAFSLAAAWPASSQDLIRNPAKPLNPNAGRILALEPVYEISDESGEFFFKYPYRFAVDGRGFLYVSDNQQLLQFSPDGAFVRNFYKPGQGPGEMSASHVSMISFCCSDDDLYVYDGRSKIIRFDREGNLNGEIRQTAERLYRLIGLRAPGFIMQGQAGETFGGGVGFKTLALEIHHLSSNGGSSEKILEFPFRIYGGSNFGMEWDPSHLAFDPAGGSLYCCHTCEYKIVRADVSNGKILNSFTRRYPRVDFVLPDYEKEFYQKTNPPKKDFADDVAGLFWSGEALWVKTSTFEKDKGVLYDVFDPEGRFLDSFFLNIDGELALVRGDFIFTKEKADDETILIKKYRLLNGPAG